VGNLLGPTLIRGQSVSVRTEYKSTLKGEMRKLLIAVPVGFSYVALREVAGVREWNLRYTVVYFSVPCC
jgi:hypothetical protein